MSAARDTGRGTRLRALEPAARAVRVRYFADEAHGWYAVPRRLLDVLGVTPDISTDSRTDRTGRIVYLERTLDTLLFTDALERAGDVLLVHAVHLVDHPCAVRTRRRFRAPAHPAPTSAPNR